MRDDGLTALRKADDEKIRQSVAVADVPSLLAALAALTGDVSLLRPEFAPDRAPMAVDAGLDAERLALARDVAARTLLRLRDGEIEPVADLDPARLRAVMRYLAGEGSDEQAEFLAEELALSGDPGAPDWRKDDLAPGVDFRVLVIGAGMSGLLAAHRLRQAGVDHVVIEKNEDVGGTWLENRYPGCRVDVPSHLYSYSFAARSDWPDHYSDRDTLLEYWRDFADSSGVRSSIRFRTEVTEAAFDEEAGVWDVRLRTADGAAETVRANVVISAVGQLNRPALPAIEGRDSFAGPAFHSARWDDSVDLRGKRVAVVGTGASALQIVPSIVDAVGSMAVFQRSAPWLAPAPTLTEPFPEGMSWLLDAVPGYAKWYRFWLFNQYAEGLLRYARRDPDWRPDASGAPRAASAANEELRARLTGYLCAQIPDDPQLRAKVIPDYPPASKRMLRDNGAWIAALRRPHVELVTEPIERITPTGIAVAGRGEMPFDVIVYATGFQAGDFLAPMKIIGRGGVDLRARWDGDATAYLGMTVPGFPNLFLMYGPNTNIVVNGSVIFFSECSARYILEAVKTLLKGPHKTMEVRPDVCARFVDEVDAGNALMAWGAPEARSWYKNRHGRVSQNWPFSLLEYWRRTREPNPADFVFD
ncbi:monooxygenase [Actinomadura rubrobrunea]|uniref:Monooxygenase n=1 Tax=Actinomadura rubrobrunea TaxID=115335 RepID=A0A9W6UV86_9ACTN|nr:NAD(P)/FAD-dependent oxidoreductase [Actinomadura rubrobrunea]GLW63678.1 monooxygenase [Actinomadura rubrobrunea]